jgi:hypothetical protein
MALVYAHRVTLPDGTPFDDILHKYDIDEAVANVFDEFDTETDKPFIAFFAKERVKMLPLSAFTSPAQVRKMQAVFVDADAAADMAETLRQFTQKWTKTAKATYGDDKKAIKEYIAKRKAIKTKLLKQEWAEEAELDQVDAATAKKVLSILYEFYAACVRHNNIVEPFRPWIRKQALRQFKADSKKLEQRMSASEQRAFDAQYDQWRAMFPDVQKVLWFKKSPLTEGKDTENWSKVLFINKSSLKTIGDKNKVNKMFRKLSKLFHPDRTAQFPLLREFLSVRWLILNEARDRALDWFDATFEMHDDDDDIAV